MIVLSVPLTIAGVLILVMSKLYIARKAKEKETTPLYNSVIIKQLSFS